MKLPTLILVSAILAGCASTTPKKGGNFHFEGIWVTQDMDQGIFNIEIFKDKTALTNYFKGPAGAKGERGTWKMEDENVVLSYNSGWHDMIVPKWERMSFQHRGYPPGTTFEDNPANIGPAFPLSGKGGEFVGVWKLGEGDRYLSLISDGASAKTFAKEPTVAGTWRVADKGVVASWEDKSSVAIKRGGMKKYSAVIQKAGKTETVEAKKQTGANP